MVKAMPDPFIPKHSTVYWYRQRTPRDILAVAKGNSASVTVGGETRQLKVGDSLKVSLGTKDPREAKDRSKDVQGQFDLIWASFRTDAVTLTFKQAVALAGEVYRDLKLVLEDNPKSPELWQRVRAANADAINGRPFRHPLAIGNDLLLDPMEERFGGFVDVVLNRHNLRVTVASRRSVLEHTARALDEVAALLGKRAEGDYSPDANAQRFPPVELPKPPTKRRSKAPTSADDTNTLTGLLAHKQRTQSQKEATYVVYRSYLGKFRDFIGHEIAARITKDDVRRWRDHLIEQGLAKKTINDQYLAALKSTLAHGVKEFDLPVNVATSIRDERPDPAPKPKGYSHEQASTILAATFKGTSKSLDIPYQRATFWVPWILAYTGLRVSEITQLRGKNVREERGIPFFLITPEDGSTKGGNAWTMGIHSHLIELGLLDMFRAMGDGPAFYTPYPTETDLRSLTDHRSKSAGDKVAEWVRDDVGIAAPGNRPNHAWRHLFTTLTRTHKMDKEARDYMMGSRSQTDAREGYGDWEPEVINEEINKLPRFVVHETAWRPPVTKVPAAPLQAERKTSTSRKNRGT